MCIYMKGVMTVVTPFKLSLAVKFQPLIISQQDMSFTSSFILIAVFLGLESYMNGVSVLFCVTRTQVFAGGGP